MAHPRDPRAPRWPWEQPVAQGGLGLGSGNPAAPPTITPEMRAAMADQLWLDSEQHWRHRVGKGWVAKRVLGRGSFGIVGHWKYEGADRDQKRLVDIVVKQSTDNNGGLQSEAALYMVLNAAKSTHIPKMYRQLCVDQGQNTVSGGYDTGNIHRIFLEYCPGGDLASLQHRLLRAPMEKDRYPSEETMWGLFHCLALSALVMFQGSENLSTFRWNREIVHFDLKQENLLIGAPASDTEHLGAAPLKVSDFGLSFDVDPRAGQSNEFHQQYQYYGTLQYLQPEQLNEDPQDNRPELYRPWWGHVERQRYGNSGNVWQMGLIMWCLQHGLQYPDNWMAMKLYESKMVHLWQKRQPHGYTVGTTEDKDDDQLPSPKDPSDPRYTYSKLLKALIKECLLIQSDKRPTAQWLVNKTRLGLQAARIASNKISLLAPLPSIAETLYPDPDISTRWYSGYPFVNMAPQAQAQQAQQPTGPAPADQGAAPLQQLQISGLANQPAQGVQPQMPQRPVVPRRPLQRGGG